MRKFLFIFMMLVASNIVAQSFKKDSIDIKIKYNKPSWSLGASTGYINIPAPNLGNNIWGSLNLGYSKNNFNITLWGGSNYWIEGKQPDLRIGITTSYTFLKW